MSSHVALSMMFALFPFLIFVLAVAGSLNFDIESTDLVYLVFGAWPDAIAHPIAKGTYWFNQHVLDATVDQVGETTKKTGIWVYENIDQKVIDGAVDGSGHVASETGHALQPTQSGKVSQYGALLFGAAAVFAIVLVIVNVS